MKMILLLVFKSKFTVLLLFYYCCIFVFNTYNNTSESMPMPDLPSIKFIFNTVPVVGLNVRLNRFTQQ